MPWNVSVRSKLQDVFDGFSQNDGTVLMIFAGSLHSDRYNIIHTANITLQTLSHVSQIN